MPRFQEIFTQEMNELHTLAFLLTADHALAEKCFVAGLEDSIRGNPVFREWARAWSKRLIISNAIKTMAPAPGQTNPARAYREAHKQPSERDALLALVLELPPFERFVFVIWVLEEHSLSDSAGLLGCTITELTRARAEALRRIATARNAGDTCSGKTSSKPAYTILRWA